MEKKPIDNVSAAKVHQAFVEVCEAIAALESAKRKLVNIHYQTKQVEDLQYVLEHLGQFAPPSDDAHETVFNQLEHAKETLRDAESGVLWGDIRTKLSEAYNATDRAWQTIKR